MTDSKAAAALRPHYRRTRWILLGLTVLSTMGAASLFYRILTVGGFNFAEAILLPLFVLLFSWVAFSFWTATYGMALILGRRPSQRETASDEKVPPGQQNVLPPTAVLMPIYNESPVDVFAGVQAMLKSLRATGHAETFDLFVLSDTTDPDIWLEEEHCWAKLVAELPGRPRVFYRRRARNLSRKAGNIADFCTRWGSHYEYMIVLDADSVMEGRTLVEMVRRMNADPQLGILQVPPTPVNRLSLLARLQQFSARLYGEIFIQGFASWAHFDSNYWGHNAIIRVEPFTQHCGLPVLPGKAPLGGEILSHDFVEAALMARAGWKVALAHDLEGSYEECPTTLLDFAKRDQRWCQGNMQHIRLIFSEGFRPISRLHLTMGAMSYLSSPLWLAFMVLSVVAMAVDGDHPAASSTWTTGAATIFGLTMAMLLLPKLWSLLALTRQPRRLREFGGWDDVVGSVLLETLISIMIAPIMMLFHTRFVVSTLLGEKVQWSAQNRGGGDIGLDEAILVYGVHTLVGVTACLAIAILAPHLLVWFLPVLIGLVLAIPIAMILGSTKLGQRLARQGLLLIPEEIARPQILYLQQQALSSRRGRMTDADRSLLFERVLTDPSFHALHRNILQATDSQIAAPRDQVIAAERLIAQQGPLAVPDDLRRVILSDADALRHLHIQVRSRMRLSSALSG